MGQVEGIPQGSWYGTNPNNALLWRKSLRITIPRCSMYGIFTYMSPYFMVNVGKINIPCMVHVGYICSLWSPKIMSWALYHPAFTEVAIGHGNGFLLGFHWYVRLPVVVISESARGIQVVACLRMFCMRLYFCVHLLPCFFGWYRGKNDFQIAPQGSWLTFWEL